VTENEEETIMAILREVKGDREYPLLGKITVIGRDLDCDIVLEAAAASRRHALILNSGDAYFIEDLDSRNGTYVNGSRIRQRTRLKPNDRLELADLEVTFLEDHSVPNAGPQQILPAASQTPAEFSATIMASLDAADSRVQVKPEAKLRAVLEISRNLSNTLDLKEVLPKILESLFLIFPQAGRGFILLRDADTGQLVPGATRHRGSPKNGTLSVSRTVIDQALRTGQAILSADAADDKRFDPSLSVQFLQIRSMMCVPMLGQCGARLGVIQLDTQDLRNQFHQEDLDVLVTASTQAARAVEFIQLYGEWRDLEAATRIQKSFLPDERPRVAGLAFFDHYAPAQHVGGDYYDYVSLPGNRLAVAIGDVAGKGISAALLMARLSAAVRFCLATAPSLPDAVRQLNAVLTRAGIEDRFVTFFVAVLDLERFTVTLVNAGHLPPLRRRAGRSEVDSLGEAIVGLPLAVIDRPYEEMVMPLEPGDTLVLYTDGLTEARNPAGDLYGADRVRAALRSAPEDVELLGQGLLADVRQFVADRPPSDDLTVVCFRRQ
jgi:serine phosphatase RsbU (regulator of sigma subunit)